LLVHLTCHRLTNPFDSKYFSISRLQLFWKLHITLLCTCAWYLYEQMYFTLNHYMLVGQEYSQFDTLLSETRRYNYSYLLCLCNYWFRNALLQVTIAHINKGSDKTMLRLVLHQVLKLHISWLVSHKV
jgi:hypothetical protein